MNIKTNIHVLSRAVIIDHDHLLLCQAIDLPGNFYFLPGGHIEHGESAKTALRREIAEEIGVKAEIERFLGCLEYQFEPVHDHICHNHEYNLVFRAKLSGLHYKMPVPQLESHIKLAWLPLSQLSSLDLRPALLIDLIPQWLASKDNPFASSITNRKLNN